MNFKFKNIINAIFCVLISSMANANCNILSNNGPISFEIHDAIGELLQNNDQCPTDVLKFRRLLKDNNLQLASTMVSNRGFHNSNSGSFSIFEIVSGTLHLPNKMITIADGDFFFGHFTAIDENHHLILDQNPQKNSLMIEAFAWDEQKNVFNFYELRGDGKQGQWFYRGNSADIYADNILLHRQPDPNHPQFGHRLRCSGCHDAGGPIMKELYSPHNDWWQKERKLDAAQPDETLHKILKDLVSAKSLSKSVRIGTKKILQTGNLTLSLQEQLRPLFCPMEINFKSDLISNDKNNYDVIIPTEFFIDSRLFNSTKGISIKRSHYEFALSVTHSNFPETHLNDADHAWLTPVKAYSDKIAIDKLIRNKVIDKKFMYAVLAIDMTNPVFSTARCNLLRYLPNFPTYHWKETFIKNLKQANTKNAIELATNLSDQGQTSEFYQYKAQHFISQCESKLKNSLNVEKMYLLLLQRRAEIKSSEISKNPLGEILEPGFRVIFPTSSSTPPAGKLSLNLDCDIVETQMIGGGNFILRN